MLDTPRISDLSRIIGRCRIGYFGCTPSKPRRLFRQQPLQLRLEHRPDPATEIIEELPVADIRQLDVRIGVAQDLGRQDEFLLALAPASAAKPAPPPL